MTSTIASKLSAVCHSAAKGAAVELGLDVDPATLAAGVDEALARPHSLVLLMRCGSRLSFEASLPVCLAFEAGLMLASQQGTAWFSDPEVPLTVRPSDVSAVFRAAVPAGPASGSAA